MRKLLFIAAPILAFSAPGALADPVVDAINTRLAIDLASQPERPPVMVQLSGGQWVSTWGCVTTDSQLRKVPCSQGGLGDGGGAQGAGADSGGGGNQ